MKKTAVCFECQEEMETTGRGTLYCPSCNVCPSCGCPQVDGFGHYPGCEETQQCEAPFCYNWVGPAGGYCSALCAIDFADWDAAPSYSVR